MGNCCKKDFSNHDFNLDKENIIKEFDEINKSFNPFYYYTLNMIERQEQKFISSGKSIKDYINSEYSYILNSKFKLSYDLCKENLEKLSDNSNVYDILFLNFVFLTLSASSNLYFKKEEICNTILSKYFTKGNDDFMKFIEAIKNISNICIKIMICFIGINLLLNIDDIDNDYDNLYIKNNSIQYNNSNFGVDSLIQLSERNGLGKYPFIKINFENLHIKFIDCFYSLFPNIKIHYPFEKYIDKTVNYALNKLFYRKNIFNEVNSEDIKVIIEDVIDLLSVDNLFLYMLK